MRLSLLDRFRASRLLSAWLLLWVFAASIGVGVHLASHVGGTSTVSTAPDDGGSGSQSALPHADCAACRVVVALSQCLPLAAAQVAALATPAHSHFLHSKATSPVDRAARWVQGFKHGPPLRSR